MIPGEIIHRADGELELNAGRANAQVDGREHRRPARSRSARTSTSTRSTRRWSSTATRRAASGSTSRPAPRSASSPGKSATVELVRLRRATAIVYGFNGRGHGPLEA